MPPWQMSAFGRAAGGMASLPCWNPDETTLDLLVMKSGHRTNLLPEMTFNLHTCRPFGMRWLRVAQAALCYYIKHIFHWDVTKIDQKHTSSVLTEIQSPHLFLSLFKRERERCCYVENSCFVFFGTICYGWCFMCILLVGQFRMQSPSSQSSLHRTPLLHQARNCLTLILQILSAHVIPHTEPCK